MRFLSSLWETIFYGLRTHVKQGENGADDGAPARRTRQRRAAAERGVGRADQLGASVGGRKAQQEQQRHQIDQHRKKVEHHRHVVDLTFQSGLPDADRQVRRRHRKDDVDRKQHAEKPNDRQRDSYKTGPA